MKIETKYGIGQEVWLMYNNSAIHRKVKRVHVSADEAGQYETYDLEQVDDCESCFDYSWEASRLFPTKEELLKSL